MAHTTLATDRESLLATARRAAQQAYAPYSHFRVGAAVVVATADGPQIVVGANVENASFGLSLCAERAALAAACALANGVRPTDAPGRHTSAPSISHVAVACVDAPSDAPANERMPCGACRQWFAELAPFATFYVDGVEGELTLADLLPNPFHLRPIAPADSEQ